MKSVKMMSALAAATLSLGTAACQMPVEGEDALLEQDAEMLVSAPDDAPSCATPVRTLGAIVFNERAIQIDWADDCVARDMQLVLVTSADNPIVEGRHSLEGELISGAGDGYFAYGSFSGLEAEEPTLVIEVLDGNGELVADAYLELMYEGSPELRVEGKVNWR